MASDTDSKHVKDFFPLDSIFGDLGSSILPIEMLSSKDETETKTEVEETKNIELVSLINSVDDR
ncbi:putative folate-biopterin transporter 2 [Gossypium australe]|uniref:Putative folate-biopterin transporter 2 n=1 Tax=Gossypium australe TaxID=47621 RepID=A0A5B6W8U0_9ROSI|nr:putative folate-biopterin transporter 2 [Gossypium australe]